MNRQFISTSSPYEKIASFSRAVVQGDWVFAFRLHRLRP